jgi:hypothetical protein
MKLSLCGMCRDGREGEKGMTEDISSTTNLKLWTKIELNYSMERSPTWEADSRSVSQEIPRVLFNGFIVVFKKKKR